MTPRERDPELTRLLVQELSRHLVALALPEVDLDAARRAVHALKGSAGLAGERELARALERVERRIRDGSAPAVHEAADIVRGAATRLAAGQSALTADWPEPPPGLASTPPRDEGLRAQYAAEAADRLSELDDALGMGDPVQGAAAAFRHVHSLKGAASAAGDDPMAWFCHGLEEQLAGATASPEAAALALDVIVRWRAVLSRLLDDPEGALQLLGAAAAGARGTTPPPTRPSTRASEPDDVATIRVSAASVDRLLDRFESVGLVRELLGVRIEAGRSKALRLRRQRAHLAEALRLIGPPRPWGAPAAALRRIEGALGTMSDIADELDVAVSMLRVNDQLLRDTTMDAKRDLAAMRLTTLGHLFARLGTAIESEARRIGRAVIVRVRRADETIDRRLAEQLVDPCLQLVRNAVAHGIESPEERVARGKPPAGTITLSARKAQNRLSVTIQDDGAGVDASEVRRRAVVSGVVAPEIAATADDDMLLALLFLPGFSTHDGIDLLAGRGIGLDITRAAVQRLGGTIRLASRRGEGMSARVDVPVESGLASVLWVHAAGEWYAIPASTTRGVGVPSAEGASQAPHFAACLEPRPSPPARYALQLEAWGEDERPTTIVVGVDDLGVTEDVLVRPVSPLVAGMGPYAGAVVRGDGSLRLAVDVDALAPRVRSWHRVDRHSDRPPRSHPVTST